jgi:hypothetical protein
VLVALLAALLSQTPDPVHLNGPIFSSPARNGAGPGPNCACKQRASKVAVRGHVQATVDGFVDFCSLSGTFDAADAGSFVSCAANTPRVMGGLFFTEPLGTNPNDGGPLLATNVLLNASQFDSPDWVKIGVAVAAPTVVADMAVGPQGVQADGGGSADWLSFPATSVSGGSISDVLKAQGSGSVGRCPELTAHVSAQAMFRGALPDAGDGVLSDGGLFLSDGGPGGFLDMGIYDGAAFHNVDGGCQYGPRYWTRCKKEDVPTGAGGDFYIGNGSLVSGYDRPAQSVFAALAGCEEGSKATSPIDARDALTNGQVWRRMPDQVEAMALSRTAWIGDSISANTVASTSSTQVFPRAPERYATDSSRTVDNWTINGSAFETDCKAEWTSWAARSHPARLIFACGINDIHINLMNGHTLWADVKTFIENTVPASTTVVLENLLPFGDYVGWTSGQDTQRLNYNGDMAAYCADAGTSRVLCCDSASAMWNPADHTKLNANDKAVDGLHLNPIGAIDLGDYTWACVRDAGF